MMAMKPTFGNTLSTEKQLVYMNIKQERLALFSVGVASGTIIGHLVVKHFNIRYSKCTVFALAYMFATAFYLIVPKHDYMIYHLSKDQIKDWMVVYNRMKTANAIFFTLAVVSLIVRV